VSLGEHGTFGDPYMLPTGPTAHLPPIPAAIFGLSYRLFGLTLLAGVGAWVAFPSLTIPQRWAILIPLLTFPLIHYAVAYMPRYREPVDWILFLLAGAAVWRARGKVARAPSAERPPGG
jgi:hypothetical protein